MVALSKSDRVAVIGAGIMGAGIAQVASAAGHPTVLYDTNRTALARGIQNVREGLERQVAKGRMSREQKDQLLSRIHPAEQIGEVAGARLIVEAIVEDLATKQSLFTQLQRFCPRDTILASNTSSLSITAIGSALSRPENLVGIHFFNPAPVMKLVEVVSGINTHSDLVETISATMLAWGKQPVVARSTPGFIVNRVARAFYAEALRMLEEGVADNSTLDAALRGGGFPMGPFELMDLIGQDVNYAVTTSIYAAFYNDPRFIPSLRQKELVDGGLLGRKSGRGFYDYRRGSERPPPVTASQCATPKAITVIGDLGVAEPLVALWRAAGIVVERKPGAQGVVILGDTRLALSDGRSATRRSRDDGAVDTVLFDLALNYEQNRQIAMARSDSCSSQAFENAIGLFQKLGKEVLIVNDTPGLPVIRTLSMLVNEAAEAVLHQVCDAAAVDTAMEAGVNYPLGPLAWADRLTPERILQVLENLQQAYGYDRYRPSQLLRRKVENGGRFH